MTILELINRQTFISNYLKFSHTCHRKLHRYWPQICLSWKFNFFFRNQFLQKSWIEWNLKQNCYCFACSTLNQAEFPSTMDKFFLYYFPVGNRQKFTWRRLQYTRNENYKGRWTFTCSVIHWKDRVGFNALSPAISPILAMLIKIMIFVHLADSVFFFDFFIFIEEFVLSHK